MLSFTLMTKTLEHLFPKADIYVSDDGMEQIEIKDVWKLQFINFFKYKKFIKEVYDCDNYAFSMKGLVANIWGNSAFGIVFVTHKNKAHALNCFLDERGRFWYFEPQDNKVYGVEEKKEYKPYLIIF